MNGSDLSRGGEEAPGLHLGERLAGAREAPLAPRHYQEVMRLCHCRANRKDHPLRLTGF